MEERERKSALSDRKETAAASCSSSAAEREPQAGDGDEAAAKVDVCSDKFDPLVALYSPSVPLPFPNIKCFNNVSDYESFLRGGRGRAKPQNVERRRQRAMKGVADPERIERLKKLMVNNPVTEAGEEGGGGGPRGGRRRQRSPKNVLTRMPLCKGSPLGELHRCVEQRIRVKVHIRTFKGLRGVCSGFVVAFDKFWNMAMVDVDETYREPLLGEALYHDKALTVSRLFEKLKLQETAVQETGSEKQRPAAPRAPRAPHSSTGGTSRPEPRLQGEDGGSLKAQGPHRKYGHVHTRHVNQLFIRGENVILVNPQPL